MAPKHFVPRPQLHRMLPKISLAADVISLKCRVSLWAPLISSPSQERLQQPPSLTVAPRAVQQTCVYSSKFKVIQDPIPPETQANFASEDAGSIPLYAYTPFLFYDAYFGPIGYFRVSSLLSPLRSSGCGLALLAPQL